MATALALLCTGRLSLWSSFRHDDDEQGGWAAPLAMRSRRDAGLVGPLEEERLASRRAVHDE